VRHSIKLKWGFSFLTPFIICQYLTVTYQQACTDWHFRGYAIVLQYPFSVGKGYYQPTVSIIPITQEEATDSSGGRSCLNHHNPHFLPNVWCFQGHVLMDVWAASQEVGHKREPPCPTCASHNRGSPRRVLTSHCCKRWKEGKSNQELRGLQMKMTFCTNSVYNLSLTQQDFNYETSFSKT